LLGAYAYVVLNPVAEGMCRRPEDWYWSSYCTTMGISADFPFVDASVAAAECGGVQQLRVVVEAIARAGRNETRRNQVPGLRNARLQRSFWPMPSAVERMLNAE